MNASEPSGRVVSLSNPSVDRVMRTWLVGFVLVTMALGTVLRWDLATAFATRHGIEFADLRHAHSHAGFYGFLTLAWWIVARRDVRCGRAFVATYAVCVTVATVLFALMGYKVPTIAMSTVVAGFWVVAVWRARKARGWFALVPAGIILGMLFIVPIAVLARRDFGLSRQLAHVFVAVIIFVAFVPAALGALGVPRFSPWAWVPTTVGGSAYMVFAADAPFPFGWLMSLAGLALLLVLRPAVARMPKHLAAAWLGLAFGLVLMGLAPPLQTDAMRVVGLHYTILFPLALTALHCLAPAKRDERQVSFMAALVAAGAMLAAMVATIIVGEGLTVVSAVAATATFGAVMLLLRPGPSRSAG